MQVSKRPYLLAAFTAGMLSISACGAQEPAKPQAPAQPQAQQPLQLGAGDAAATVNGVAIPKSKLEFAVKQRVAGGGQDTPELRAAVRDDLINRELISQEARKKGLDKNPDTASQIEFAQQSVLIGAYVQDYLKTNPPSDEDMKKEYDKVKGQMGELEYKARHILVGTEDEAKKIIADVKKDGKKWDKLAEKSKDTGSAKKGGQLEWSPPSNYVPPFAEALKHLKKGEMTQTPVQSQFGWHVIKLEDTRPIKFPAFEDVKPQLAQQMQQQQIQKMVSDLRSKAKVE